MIFCQFKWSNRWSATAGLERRGVSPDLHWPRARGRIRGSWPRSEYHPFEPPQSLELPDQLFAPCPADKVLEKEVDRFHSRIGEGNPLTDGRVKALIHVQQEHPQDSRLVPVSEHLLVGRVFGKGDFQSGSILKEEVRIVERVGVQCQTMVSSKVFVPWLRRYVVKNAFRPEGKLKSGKHLLDDYAEESSPSAGPLEQAKPFQPPQHGSLDDSLVSFPPMPRR